MMLNADSVQKRGNLKNKLSDATEARYAHTSELDVLEMQPSGTIIN